MPFGFKRIITVCAVLAALTLLAAGCSNEPENALDRVKSKGEVSFAMSGGYPPFNFYNDKNELVGFDVDVAREVARRLGVELRPVTTEWSGIIEGLRSGTYDGILGSMAITPERLKVVDFSVPYYYSGAQLLVRADADFTSTADLAGKAVGVVTGTTFEGDAKGLNAGEVRLYKDDTQTLTELNSGVLDGVITDRVVGIGAMNSGKFAVKLLGTPLRSEDIGVAFRKDDGALTAAVNKILTAMHEDGTLSRFSDKWLGVDVSTK